MTGQPDPGSSDDVGARVQAMVEGRALQKATSLAEVLQGVARYRGRPVELEPLPADADAGHVFGVCLPYPDRDVILFRTGAGPDHELHSILHECGHLLLDHVATADTPQTPTDPERLSALLPDLDPALVAAALARSSYEDTHEQEAETFAMVMREVLEVGQRRRGDAVLARFDDALG